MSPMAQLQEATIAALQALRMPVDGGAVRPAGRAGGTREEQTYRLSRSAADGEMEERERKRSRGGSRKRTCRG